MDNSINLGFSILLVDNSQTNSFFFSFKVKKTNIHGNKVKTGLGMQKNQHQCVCGEVRASHTREVI